MIKIVAIATILFNLAISGICYFVWNIDFAFSSLFGGAVIVTNLLSLWIFWKLIFSKKSIALALLIIIFKYLILGLIFWNLSQFQWMRPIGFILGLSSLVFGIVSSTVFKKT